MRSLLRPFNFHRPKKVLLLLVLTLVLIFVYQLYRWNRALSSSLQGGPRLSPHHQEAYDHAIFNREGQSKQSQAKEGRTRFLLPNRSNFFIPGVPPADRELYRLAFETGEGTFACLRSKERLDVNLVNDDYCDCADGSDEPSTSACSHLPHSRFFCSAACGQTSHMSVPASRVNDG